MFVSSSVAMGTTGSPAVSLYTNQPVADPATLSVAILNFAVAAGETSAQPSAPRTAASQPPPDLTSVPVRLHLTARDAAASARDTSQNPLRSVDSSSVEFQPQVDI